MTTYVWNVTSGNFGAATSWDPEAIPTSADGLEIDTSTSIFGVGSGSTLSIFDEITVTISAALTTTLANWADINGVSGTTATVDVDSSWNNNSEVTVGVNGYGYGVVNVDGGSFTTGWLNIGTNYSDSSPVYAGTVTVSNGGAVNTTGGWDNVGDYQGASGVITVTGAGSSWNSSGNLNIGDVGTGVLTVENDATLSAYNLDVGVNYDQQSVAAGNGTATIESGAVVTTYGEYQEIGSDATGSADDVTHGASGAVTVTGAKSEWDAYVGNISIGDAGSTSGSLTVSNGGLVVSTGAMWIGSEYAGQDGSYGTLTIESGGTVAMYGTAATGGAWSGVGSNYSGIPNSTALVTGAGSSWSVDELIVYKSGVLQATQGARIETENGFGLEGGVVQVDGESSLELGSDSAANFGAALGYVTVDADPGYDANFFGVGTVEANVIDNGKIYSNEIGGQGTLTFEGSTGVADTGTLTGTGWLYVGTGSPLDLATATVASSLNVGFGGWDGTLEIESTGFSAPISDFEAGNTIDIQGLAYDSAASSYTFTPSGSIGGGTLVIHEGASSTTLDIAYTPKTLSGALTLSNYAGGTGTTVSFTNGAAQSPFNLWSAPGSLFNTAAGTVNGEDYGLSNATDGGTPVWVDTETPSYVDGATANYSIVLATQEWLGDVQPEITIATDNAIVDPFGTTSVGNLAGDAIFSNNSSRGLGAVIYWTASTTSGDYAVDLEPFTVTYPSSQPTSSLVTVTGAPVTMIAAIANPLNWTFSTETSTSLVFAYLTKDTSSTENIYMQGFTSGGVATNAAPVLVASALPDGTPYYIGYDSNSNDSLYGYGYRYLEVDSSVGTGLVGGSFNTTTGAVGAPELLLSLPNYTAFDGVSSHTLSSGNAIRFVEGVENGLDVIQSFLGSNATATATIQLSSPTDHYQVVYVYDANTAAPDYSVVAYTDNNQVHLRMFNELGQQIGGDFIVPGITSFLRLTSMQGSNVQSSTRVELDYEVTDPSGGQEVETLIYDTTSGPYQSTLNGEGLWQGTPFDDTFTWGAGVSTIDGGGGVDTFVATNLTTVNSNLTITINAAGETIVNDGAGDIDTLVGFTTIDLADATVTISGNTLTMVKSDGTKGVETFNITGQSYVETVQYYTAAGGLISTTEYNSHGALVGQSFGTEVPNEFTGDGRSDMLFEGEFPASPSSAGLVTWQVNNTTVTGGGGLGNPGVGWTYQGSGDFYGNGDSDVLWRNQAGQLEIWEMNGTTVVASTQIGNPGGSWNVVDIADFNGNGYSDILFEDASGNLAMWEMKGTAIVGGGSLGSPGAAWTLLGVGDFTGNGDSDLLFENKATGQYSTWLLNGASITGGAVLGTLGANWAYKGVGDFAGMGDSDILFENTTTGLYATWDVTNDVVSGGGGIGTPGPDYTFEAIGDYTSSGTGDILFKDVLTGQYVTWDIANTTITGGGVLGNPGADYALATGLPALAAAEIAPTLVFDNASGEIATWTIANGAISGGGVIGNPGASYTELAVGDFYGDGQSDVLFESTSGTYAIWRTNGSSVDGGGAIGSAAGYTFKGLGDFNGDGTSDMLFENAAGNYAVWEMNGTSIIGGANWGTEAGLTFVATGDFTGDGTSDVLFKDGTGNYYVGLVNNGQLLTPVEVGNVSGYTFAGVGDLNGDGKTDILFENTATGVYASWDMNGTSIVGGGSIGNPGSGWTFEGVAALNAAGHASLVFENSAGQIATWEMNDTAIIGGGLLGTAAGFTVVGAR